MEKRHFNLLAQYILVALRKIKSFFQVEELCNNICFKQFNWANYIKTG